MVFRCGDETMPSTALVRGSYEGAYHDRTSITVEQLEVDSDGGQAVDARVGLRHNVLQ